MADSSTGGFLPPSVSPAPLVDDALGDFIQAWVVGITGLTGSLVRPRWQPEPPNQPDVATNWCAIGIMNRRSDVFASETHVAKVPSGESEIRRHEEIELLASFYGPAAESYMSLFREGAQVAQNREYLYAQSMGLVETGDAINVPELVKERWVNRIDLPFTLRRRILRKFAVLDIVGYDVTLNNEEYTETIVP